MRVRDGSGADGRRRWTGSPPGPLWAFDASPGMVNSHQHAVPSGSKEAHAMRNQHWDKLRNEQQDHLFYALHDAREAARERWLMDRGKAMPVRVERALASSTSSSCRMKLPSGALSEPWCLA